MPKIRALVVDDAVVMRRMITQALGNAPDIEVAGAAANGVIALQKLEQVNPDVVTLDVEMPEMDGLETLKEIRKTHPSLPVIMFSTLTERGAVVTVEALTSGATDYVTKPANVGNITEGINRLEEQLIPRIRACCSRSSSPVPQLPSTPKETSLPTVRDFSGITPEIICIGCSTGGPNALAEIFEGQNYSLEVPIVIVQHMPPKFTGFLAERLNAKSPLSFYEGEDGMPIEPGSAYIAPGGRHMTVEKNVSGNCLRLNDLPPENSCRPAVDVLFRSVAENYGNNAAAFILTGMGYDGKNGCQHLYEKGAPITIQDMQTSVVWGIPGAVSEAGIADKVLPLGKISNELIHYDKLHRSIIAK